MSQQLKFWLTLAKASLTAEVHICKWVDKFSLINAKYFKFH